MPHVIYGLCEPSTDFVRYVGHSKNSDRHWKSHIKEAMKQAGTHKCHWIRKILGQKLEPGIVVLEVINPDDRIAREQYWIKKLKLTNDLTNATAGGDGTIDPSDATRRKIGRASAIRARNRTVQPFTGHKHTEESKQKMREALAKSDRTKHRRAMRKLRGVPFSEEHRRKIGDANRGKVRTLAQRAALSERLKGNKFWLGKKHTEQSKAKIGAAKLGQTPWLGKHHNESTKHKIRLAKLGHRHTEEAKTKMSETRKGNNYNLGRKHSELTKIQMGLSRLGNSNASGNKGKPKSIEHRMAISAALRARSQEQKGIQP